MTGSDEPCVLARPVQRRGEGTEPIADGGGFFESFGVRQPTHPCFERSEEPVRGLEGGEEIPDELSVALGVDPAVARGGTSADAGEGAGAEPGACAHRAGAATERDDLLERLLRQPGRRRSRKGSEVRAAVVGPSSMNHLEARERLGRIELQVGEPAPRRAATVVLGLVAPDQPRLENQGLELATRRFLTFHAVDLAQEVLHLLAFVAVEVGLHARPKVPGLADVENAIVPADEAVDAGRAGEGVREADLAVVRASACRHRLAEIAERQDPQAGAEIEELIEDLGARHGVVERPMDRLHPGAEVPGQRLQSDVGNLRPHHPPGELRRAHGRSLKHGVLEPTEVLVQEREIESRVVRHEDRPPGELEERGKHRFDRWLLADEEIVDARQVRDERRDGFPWVHECLEAADPLSAEHADRADLGDPRVPRRATRRLDVHHHEVDLPERHALLECGLDGYREHGRLRSVGPTGRHTVSNRCSMVKDRGSPVGLFPHPGERADMGSGYFAGRRKIFDRVQGL